MRCYADTSFLVKLLTDEPDSESAFAEFRRLGFPRLFYTSLHSLEVTNAIRQKAFHRLRSVSSNRGRTDIARERDTALMRLDRGLKRGWLLDSAIDYEKALSRARTLSGKHTEQLGCRGFDLLHVALALEFECETFLSADRIQASVAKAEELTVVTP